MEDHNLCHADNHSKPLGFALLAADTSGMKTLYTNGHRIDAPGSSLSGFEVVRYDGEQVSRKWSILGAKHAFTAQEDGRNVDYLVEIGTRWLGFTATCRIIRDGEVLFSDC